jgi:hypothetical protein
MDWIIIAHGKTDEHIIDDEHEYLSNSSHSIDSDVDYDETYVKHDGNEYLLLF